MKSRQGWFTLVALLGLLPRLSAQEFDLSEKELKGSCYRQELTMNLNGKVAVQEGKNTKEYSQKAEARHEFTERILEASRTPADKSVRIYTRAEGTLTFNGKPASISLSEKRRFLVAHRVHEQLVCYHPQENMPREELEVTEHFDTLAVPGLVPNKKVKLSETWKVSNATVAALCDVDGLIKQDLECKLEKVDNQIAQVSVVGKASGISLGAQVNLMVEARYLFDLEQQRLLEIEWKQSDQRDRGPVSPAMSADVVYQLKRAALAEVPANLSDIALIAIPDDKTPPQNLITLVHRDPKNRFEMKISRDWHYTGMDDANERTVFRLMDRGTFVAQVTISPYKKASFNNNKPAAMTMSDFEGFMKVAPGWEETRDIEETKAAEAPKDHVYYRRTAEGKLDGLETVQTFYYLLNPQGEQTFVTFTMSKDQADQLNGRDLTLIRDFTWPTTAVSTDAEPSEK